MSGDERKRRRARALFKPVIIFRSSHLANSTYGMIEDETEMSKKLPSPFVFCPFLAADFVYLLAADILSEIRGVPNC